MNEVAPYMWNQQPFHNLKGNLPLFCINARIVH